MKSIRFVNNNFSLKTIRIASSILAPIVDNRFVPYPWMMVLVVTRRCNAKCQMCNIWQEKNPSELSLKDLEIILTRNDLSFIRFLTLTGGEPTLRKDLPQIFKISIENLRNLEEVHLATSGLNTQRTINYIHKMMGILSTHENKIYRFTVQISLDGIEKIHDTIRGIPGFYQKTLSTINGLIKLKKNYPLLHIRLSSVLMRQNTAYAKQIHEFAREKGLEIHFSPVVFSDSYYSNLINQPLLYESNMDGTSSFFANLHKSDHSSLRFYYEDAANMLLGNERKRRCMMGFFAFVLEHDGNVYPCLNCENNSFGNLLIDSFDKIWFNKKSLVRERLRSDCCPNCTSMCYTLPVNIFEMTNLIWVKKIRPFLREYS